MDRASLQEQCELGQRQLMEMDYLAAEATLAGAEKFAWETRDFDSLARLYLPLQEARRQRRQRCGEGPIMRCFVPTDPQVAIKTLDEFRHGQLIVAGPTLAPAAEVRRVAAARKLYVDVFLAIVYQINKELVIAGAPLRTCVMPGREISSMEALRTALPPHCLILDPQKQNALKSYSDVMAVWEQLQAPYMAAADSTTANPLKQIEAYRLAIEVDYACELAHQKISDIARRLAQTK